MPARLDRVQRREHHRDAALHVGDSGAVQHTVLDPAHLLKRVVGPEYGVHVAGNEQLRRCVRPDRDMKVAPVLDLHSLARHIDRLDRCGFDQLDRAGKGGERIRQQPRHLLQPREIARPAVDRRPRFDLVEHRLGRGASDDLLFDGGEAPHGPVP